jgi:hypothetical protein
MSGSIKRSLALLCPLLTAAPPCTAWEHDWTVVTLTRNGMWGVASDSSQPQAISKAISLCRQMAGPSRLIAALCSRLPRADGSLPIGVGYDAFQNERPVMSLTGTKRTKVTHSGNVRFQRQSRRRSRLNTMSAFDPTRTLRAS